MPGQKGESGKKPTMNKEGAYANSANTMGGADTPNIQGWNSYDGSQAVRGGGITNKNSGGKGGMRKGGDY